MSRAPAPGMQGETLGTWPSKARAIDEATACAPATPITTLGFVTKDRPRALRRAVTSYARGLARCGRSVEIVVADDSSVPAPGIGAELARIAARAGVRLLHLDGLAKRRFARALVARGLPRRVVEFALFDPEGCGCAIGANRNALLLMRAGEKMLVADDDTIGRTAVVESRQPGLVLGAERDPTELWFARDRAAALAEVTFAEIDLIGEHEALLGRSPSDLVARALAAGEPVAADEMCGHLMRSVAGRRGAVPVTLAGIVGDSGMYSGAGLLHARGPTRERLTRSTAHYALAFESREVVRIARRATVTHGPPCMATTIGLDATDLLPPFMPVLRNEDGVFGVSLVRCFADVYFAHVPVAVVHAPPPRGGYSPDPIAAASHIRFGDLLIAAMTIQPMPPALDRAAALRGMGAALMALAAQPLDRFERIMRATLRSRADAITRQLEADLVHHEGSLPRWANDVRARIDALRGAAEREDYVVPVDLRSGRSLGGAGELSQRLVGRVGELMQHWPSLVEAAREVRIEQQREHGGHDEDRAARVGTNRRGDDSGSELHGRVQQRGSCAAGGGAADTG